MEHPADFRFGDERLNGSPFCEPTSFDEATQSIDDCLYFVKNAELFMSAGKRTQALSEARDALVALQDAIALLEAA